MKVLIQKMDFFSPKVGLYFQESNRYTSPIGFAMTLLFFFEIVGFGLYFIIRFIHGEQMTVISTTDLSRKNISGNMTEKVFGVKIRDSQGESIDPRVVEVVGTYWTTTTNTTDIEYLTSIPCKKSKKGEKDNFDEDVDISEYFCFKREKSDEGLMVDISYPATRKYINIYLKKCQNATEEGGECLSPERIEEVLQSQSYFVHFITETNSIDHTEKYPFSSSYYTESLPISRDTVYFHSYQLKMDIYETDQGFLFPDIRRYFGYGLDTNNREVDAYSTDQKFLVDDPLVVVQLTMNGITVEKYIRSYQKLQSVFADIGGISSVGYFISEFFTFFFYKGSVILSIVEFSTEEGGGTSSSFKRVFSGFKNNNFIVTSEKKSKNTVTKPSMDMTTNKLQNFERRNRRSYYWYEIMCYRCCMNKKNCQYLQEYEKTIKKYLDVKNFICFSRQIELSKLGTYGTQRRAVGTLEVDGLEQSQTKNMAYNVFPKETNEYILDKQPEPGLFQ